MNIYTVNDYLINKVKFKTDLFLASVPAMLDSPYRWIIDITQKG